MKCPNCESESFYIKSDRIVFIDHIEEGKIEYEYSNDNFSNEFRCRDCDTIIFRYVENQDIEDILSTNNLNVFE